MEDFRFYSPGYFFLLLALPVLQLILHRIHRGAKDRLLLFVAETNLKSLLREKGKGGGERKRLLFWLGIVFLILALARPQANPIVEEMEGASLDIYVLLDVSRSMDAEDIPPSRLKKAKKSIESLTHLLAGDRIGVIAFAGTAVILSPLTADYEVIKLFLQNVDTSLIQNQGTDILGALDLANRAMERGAEKVGPGGPRTNVFLVMSDGEDHNHTDWSVVDKIRDQGGTIFSIAFGTEAGASIPVRNERGELFGYKRDAAGTPVKTSVQIKSLQEIAQRGGGQFYFSTPDEAELRDVLVRIQGLDRTEAVTKKARIYQEYFIPFLAAGIFCLIFSFFSIRALFTKALRKAFLFLFFSSLVLDNAQASPFSFLWDKEKRTFDASQKLAEEGKTEEAVNQWNELLAESPDSPEINYNIGTLLLEGKKGDEGRVPLQRLLNHENPLRHRALFNIAGSYATEEKKEQARATYAELIDSLRKLPNPSTEDQELLQMAVENLKRLADPQKNPQGGGQNNQQPPPQENPENKDQKKQENKSQQGQDNKDPSEDKKNEDEKDKKDQNQDNKDQNPEQKPPEPKGLQKKRPNFQEKNNMGEDDAKRMLEALKQRENNLQKRFLKNKDKGSERPDNANDKDW